MKIECPNCGGNLIYVIGSNHVICEYCKAKVDVSHIHNKEFLEFAEEIKEQKMANDKKENQYIYEMLGDNKSMDLSSLDLHMFKCDKCNSEYIHSNLIRGKSCPYCFNMNKKEIGMTNGVPISKIIPFSINKNNISNIVCNSIDSSEFTPDHVFAMYVPFSISYDEVSASGTVKIKGNNKEVSVKEKIITARYIGKSLDKKMVERCIDFDFSKYQAFNKKLFSHSIVVDNFDLKNTRNEKEIKDKITDSINYDIYVKEKMNAISNSNLELKVSNIKEEVWLLPIYVFKDTYDGIVNVMLINGQNGRIVGKAISHNPTRIMVKKISTIALIFFVMGFFLIISFSLNESINNSTIVCFVFVIMMCIIPVLKPTYVKKIDSDNYKFYGVSWDKEINIS